MKCHHYNLQSLFFEVVCQNKERVAIRDFERNYTYQDLELRSDELAVYLQFCAVEQGAVVGIVSTKHFDDYALMIACLKLGVTYTNIDIDNPRVRVEQIIETCQPKLIFSNSPVDKFIEVCAKQGVTYLTYATLKSTKQRPIYKDFDGNTIAYIMFTSGSTGVPKGVAITHQNLLHFIAWTVAQYQIQPSDNFANISPMYFDNSVFDFYSALFNGASITPIPKSLTAQPLEMVHYIEQHACTIWFSVPSMLMYLQTMKVLNSNSLKSIRVFTFGGEGFPKAELKKLYDLYNERAIFINVYGPTECTCICSSYKITDGDFEQLDDLPSLGKINPNFAYVILDDNNKQSKQGQLCLLGPNVGKGYYNNQSQTNRVFTLYTDEKHYNKEMYCTGDLVEERDGLLYFKGRIDNQIKHMGYRIELEEIENALNDIPSIKRSAVLYHRISDIYGKITAFIVLEDGQDDLKVVKELLQEKVPAYMLPNQYEILDSFPLNANGKLDKKKIKTLLY